MKGADGLAFAFFTLDGETGLINENEGDIPQTCGRGGIGRRAALRSLWANPRGSSSLLGRTIFLLKPAENIAIFPFYAPRVVQLVTNKTGSVNFCHPMVQNFERIPFPISLTNTRSFPAAQLINYI